MSDLIACVLVNLSSVQNMAIDSLILRVDLHKVPEMLDGVTPGTLQT